MGTQCFSHFPKSVHMTSECLRSPSYFKNVSFIILLCEYKKFCWLQTVTNWLMLIPVRLAKISNLYLPVFFFMRITKIYLVLNEFEKKKAPQKNPQQKTVSVCTDSVKSSRKMHTTEKMYIFIYNRNKTGRNIHFIFISFKKYNSFYLLMPKQTGENKILCTLTDLLKQIKDCILVFHHHASLA